jgi:hypothetical protein
MRKRHPCDPLLRGHRFAQSEASSEFFGVPGAAIDTGPVDAVVPLTDLAQAIEAHVNDAGELDARLRGASRHYS